MQEVFRVQDSNGRGPFKPGFSHIWVVERDDHRYLKPWFLEFGPVHVQIPSCCHGGSACETLEQLRRWFTKDEYEKLKRLGYKSYKVPVTRIIARSKIQCFVSSVTPFNQKATPISLY